MSNATGQPTEILDIMLKSINEVAHAHANDTVYQYQIPFDEIKHISAAIPLHKNIIQSTLRHEVME